MEEEAPETAPAPAVAAVGVGEEVTDSAAAATTTTAGGDDSVDVDLEEMARAQLGAAAAARTESKRKAKQLKRAAAGKASAAGTAVAGFGTLTRDDVARLYAKGAVADIVFGPSQKRKVCLAVEEVQALVLAIMGVRPTVPWCFVSNRPLITGILLLIVRGASFGDFCAAEARLPSSAGVSAATAAAAASSTATTTGLALRRGGLALPTKMARGYWTAATHTVRPADDSLLYVSGGDARREARGRLDVVPPPASPAELAGRLAAIALRLDEAASHGFPLPPRGDGRPGSLPPDFTATATALADVAAGAVPDAAEVVRVWGAPRVLALDCEMCATDAGLQLARATLVDAGTGATLFDEYVVPVLPVRDYLTQYSGVTPALLASATCTAVEARAAIARHLDAPADGSAPPAFLVGHSVECDLAALRLAHSRIIDTSVAYLHPSGLPYRHALRNLAASYLGTTIQADDRGHDSAEDARTAGALVHRLLYGSLPPMDGAAPAAAAAAAEDVHATWAAALHGEPRAHMVADEAVAAELAARRAARSTATAAATANGGAGQTAGAKRRRPEGEGGSGEGEWRSRRQTIFVDAAAAAVGGISIIGSPEFCRFHVCLAASGTSVAARPRMADCKVIMGLAAARLHKPSSLVVAEMTMPRLAPATGGGGGGSSGGGDGDGDATAPPDIVAFDAFLQDAITTSLPPSTALITVFQGHVRDTRPLPDGERVRAAAPAAVRDFVAPDTPAAFGLTYLRIVPPRPAA